ncbi:3-dehydroquinate synthase [Halobacillus karajensis]|uniref:3-dehydroquinate synthase n=1 Tax=Halobacillus karajensis TaxID=195088 RepID=A0A024P1Q7_9BACI|nr:3-dehydroquinate synthase [Halobacillus karajensis]CDQ19501.1 3-dehydroquinate synthase [Halobacillus karajensis]CDQ21963.1 3-dehydroquinate synthase [Halobacillus karajensis]CDQ27804.1 3-dehydroquinate synthase [Halobacillus karajensis]SEH81332.1 3-dehydroquinate synthase [Halobacillus karajensis]
MVSVTIHATTHDYDVVIGKDLRNKVTELIDSDYTSILVITDDKVETHYLNEVASSLKENFEVHTAIVPAGESSKSMRMYEKVLDRCVEARLDRQSLIIALGGGMIGDLAGYVASTYLRGVDYIQMPTTILAHDSSVGGKVAINHPNGKNLIGSFYNPTKVIYDIETIDTLPESEIRSGYGEVIKHAFLSDEGWSKTLLEVDIQRVTKEQLETDLTRGIHVKASIVEQDERETGLRKHLNLGHTLAHAIEAELGYGEITHGEAVAIGLLFMMKLSEEVVGAELPVKEFTEWLKKNNYPLSLLSTLDSEHMVERMLWDKKTVGQEINFVLLKKISDACVLNVDKKEIVKQLNLLKAEVSGE